VRVIRDDGRHFIRTTKEKFDIITSDPIDPWVKGCAALNTVDYYEMCKAHLNPGGVVSLWMALYENDSTSVKSLIATFCKVFPDAIFWSNDYNGEGYDAVLFGQPDGTHIDLDKLQARLDRPDYAQVKQSLDEVGFHSGVDLLATFAGRGPDLKQWMSDAQINTDVNMRLQYLAGWAFNNYKGRQVLSDITHSYRFPDEVFTGSEEQVSALKEKLRMRQQ
jgi:spermidine synthase